MGIDKAVTAAVEELKKLSRPVKDKAQIAQVGTISANHDETIGKLLADAMDKVGKDGVITVEEAQGIETELDVVEGLQFDKGYISPYFVNQPETMLCELEDASSSSTRSGSTTCASCSPCSRRSRRRARRS